MHVALILQALLGTSMALGRPMPASQQNNGGAASLSPRHTFLSSPPQVNPPFVPRGEYPASREAANDGAEHRAVSKRFSENLKRTTVAINWLLKHKEEFFAGTWSKRRDAALIAARRFGFVDDDDVAEYRAMFSKHKPAVSYVAQAEQSFGRGGIQALSDLLDSNDKLLSGIDPAKINDTSESREYRADVRADVTDSV